MITRVRLEASSGIALDVRIELVNMLEVIQTHLGGEWEEEDPGLEIQTTKTGYWGRLTIRKHGHDSKIQRRA